MKITSIKQQVKKQGRVSIFIDGAYAFALSESGLLESKLFKGQELTPEDIHRLKEHSDTDTLYGKVLRFVALRSRSEWEIQQYLLRKHASPATSQAILTKLRKAGMINDVAFASMWVENRHLLKPTSRRRLIQELRAKHVTNDAIELVLAADETDEQAILKELISKKLRQVKYRDDSLKLMQYLARQGFNYDDIKSALPYTS
jgi:regulatory protein